MNILKISLAALFAAWLTGCDYAGFAIGGAAQDQPDIITNTDVNVSNDTTVEGTTEGESSESVEGTTTVTNPDGESALCVTGTDKLYENGACSCGSFEAGKCGA